MVLEHTQTHPPRNHHQTSIGNGEAKELICMIHGHELRGAGWNAGGRGEWGQNVHGIRSIIGTHKIDRGMLRIV